MSQPDPSARPSQVTVAGWALAVASTLLVLAVFDTMGKLETVDMRDRLSHAISSGSAKDLGFTVDDAISVLRWCLYVSGVAAAASGILGVFVLQGHRGARIGVSIAAVPIVLTSTVAGSFPGFLAMFIGVGSALLWTRPARDWFAGRPVTLAPPARPPQPPPPRPDEPTQKVAWAPPAPGDLQPPPTPGWGVAPGSTPPPPPPPPPAPSWPAPSWPAPSWPAPAAGIARQDAPRPAQVRVACILTWVFSSLTALGYAAVLVVLAVDKDRLIDELKKSPSWKSSFDTDTVTTAATVASVFFLLWSVAAVVLAVLAWRRVRWAWIVLLVSAAVAGLVSLLALPYSLPYVAAIGVTTGMLLRRSTRDWFTATPYPPYPPYPQQQQPPAPRPPVW